MAKAKREMCQATGLLELAADASCSAQLLRGLPERPEPHTLGLMHFLPQDRQTIPLGATGADEEGKDYGPYPVGTAAAEIWTLDPFAQSGLLPDTALLP